MTLPEHYDLTIKQGATLKEWWKAVYPDGTVIDFADAGYEVGTLTIKDQYGDDGTVLVELTTDNGGLVIEYQADANGTYWSGYLYMSSAATAALTDWGDGVLDLEVSDGAGDDIPIFEGAAWLSPTTIT